MPWRQALLQAQVTVRQGLFTVSGQGFRGLSAGPQLSVNPPGVNITMVVTSATLLTLTCNATVWYWSNANLTFTQIGSTGTARITKPLFGGATTPGAISLSYGAPLPLAGYLMGTAGPTAVTLVTGTGQVNATCSFVAPAGVNGTTCTPWLLKDAMFDTPLTVRVTFSVGAGPVVLPGVNVTVSRPQLQWAASGVVAGGGRGAAVMPLGARLPSVGAVWSSAGVGVPAKWPDAGRTWVRSPRVPTARAGGTWGYANATTVGGAAPPGDGDAVPVRVVLGSMLSATSGTTRGGPPVAYVAPRVLSVQPAAITAVPCSAGGVAGGGHVCAPATNFTLGGTDLVVVEVAPPDALRVRIAHVTVGGVPCASLTVVVARTRNATLVCVWPGAVVDAQVSAALPTSESVALAAAWQVPGGGANGSVAAAVAVVVRPRVLSVVPVLATPGSRVTISATGLAAGGDAPTVTLGGVPCGGLTVLTAAMVACDAPVVSALTPGYPQVTVNVTAATGLATVTLRSVSYTSPLTVSWQTAPPVAGTVLLPSGRQAGTRATWAGAPALVVTGVGSGSCWVEVANVTAGNASLDGSSSSSSAGWVVGHGVAASGGQVGGLVGTTTARVLLNASAPLATPVFDSVGLTGGSELTATMSAYCLDELGRLSPAYPSWRLALPSLAARWDAAGGGVLSAPVPPGVLAAVNASVAWVGVDVAPPSQAYEDAAHQVSCAAAVYDGSAGSPASGESLTGFLMQAGVSAWSTASGTVLATEGCDAGVAASLPSTRPVSCWRVVFAGLSVEAAPLGVAVALAAECEWVPTGERVRLLTLHGVVMTAAVAWSLPASSSLFMDTPIATTAAIVHNALPAHWAAAAPSCHLAVRSGDARLTASAAAAEYSVDDSGSVAPAIRVEVTGLPRMTVSIVLTCRVWGVAVESSERSIVIQQLHLVPIRLPTTYLPSDGATALLLNPQPSLRLVDDDGVGVDGVTCALAATTNGAEVRNVAGGAAQAVSTGGWLNFTAAVVVSSFGVPSAALTVACTRATPDAPEAAAWTATLTRLTLDVCEPLAPVTDASNGVPPWHIGVAMDGVSPCVASLVNTLSPTARQHVACAITPLVATYDAGGFTANGAFQLFVIGGTVHGAAPDGSVIFDALQLIGSRGMRYNVSVACTLGTVAIPATHVFSVQVLPCPAGFAPSGRYCGRCGAGYYTRGDNEQACLPCPAQGAECVNGLLVLQSNFYRALDEVGTLVGPASQLLPCYNNEACVVNATIEAYGCAPGYTGTLCGVCAAGYTKFSSMCRPCWSSTASVTAAACSPT